MTDRMRAMPSARATAASQSSPQAVSSKAGVPIAAQRYDLMTQPDRAALRGRYVEQQGGLCHHCQGPLNEAPPEEIQAKHIDWRRFPPNFTRHPVHLHHSHRTGLTIGAVHSLCNAVLWQYHGE